MKAYVLIDGENFVHAVMRVLGTNKIVSSRKSLRRLRMATLFRDLPTAPDEIRYYTTRIHAPMPSNSLFATAEAMRKWNAYWVPYIANQGVIFIKAGQLKVRDAKRCANCGHKAEVLIEKGVDVRLGVDIVSLAEPGVAIYLFSSDSDLIPAVLAARHRGARVIYITTRDGLNHAMSKSVNATVCIEDGAAIAAYREANNGKA